MVSADKQVKLKHNNLSAVGSKNVSKVKLVHKQNIKQNKINSPNFPAESEGDGIIVTVHAPEGEFDDTDSEMSFEEGTVRDQPEPDNLLQLPDTRQVVLMDRSNKSQECEQQFKTEQEILKKYENNPYFKNLVQ